MAKLDWKSVTREDVIKAIDIFLKESPEYPSPRSTYLLYNGKKLPAKHIRGMAYKIAYNREISKEDYSGGMETVRFFKRLGFEVLHVEKVDKTKHTKQETYFLTKNNKQVKKKCEEGKLLPAENEKLKITTKHVIEQKNALQLILNKLFNGDIVCEKTFDWLKTPDKIEGEYVDIYNALFTYRGNRDFARKSISLRCDFVCESRKIIIEYDERQHFSEARKLTLESYGNITTHYNKDLWIKACKDIQAKDSQPINRDEIRAYYDSTRDIEAVKHGYTLIRIMHGQINFEKEDAQRKLEALIKKSEQNEVLKLPKIKIAMYLQDTQRRNKEEFNNAMSIVKHSNADILVFPEFCWVPFWRVLEEVDLTLADDVDRIIEKCLELSREINRAVIISSCDRYGTIYSVFANANASQEETKYGMYIKHTMTNYSAFDFRDYAALAQQLFEPIIYKGYRIGMTICYDCNHALFSRMYGVQGVDIIINSTGGNVVYDKWYKYNCARAIENNCYTFVTMGGEVEKNKKNSFVYGFNPNGKKLNAHTLGEVGEQDKAISGIYLYDLEDDESGGEKENSIDQLKTKNKYRDLFIPVGNIDLILEKALNIDKNLYVYRHGDINVVIIITRENEIFYVENFLPLIYSEKLKEFSNKRYILVSKYKKLDKQIYTNKLSLILKVRAMENFCAVILESDIENNCYQTGKNRTAQVLEESDGMFELDLSRMTGPEAIWKNKSGECRADWREKYKWLANKCKYISDHKVWE